MTNRTADDFDYFGFAHRLRAARIALGLSEEQAAAAAGRTAQTWRRYEATGKGNCTQPLRRFCERFDVSIDWVVLGDTRMLHRGELSH